jgi:hypothetical protein
MAGEAKTTQVLLSTATLMIGSSANVMSLDPVTNSIGLVKNLRVQTDMSFTELTQGVTNQVMMSVQTKLDAKISCEVYEYTAGNLAYGAGLDGSTLSSATATYTLNADITGGSGTVALTAGQGVNFTANSWVVLQDQTAPDRIHVGKVQSVATDTLTLTTATQVPAGKTFSKATTIVYKVNKVDVGSNVAQPTFGVKAVGILPATGEPVALIFPKVKITKGLDLSFESNNFSNMPFEFTPYVPVPADPFYSDFTNKLYSILKQ